MASFNRRHWRDNQIEVHWCKRSACQVWRSRRGRGGHLSYNVVIAMGLVWHNMFSYQSALNPLKFLICSLNHVKLAFSIRAVHHISCEGLLCATIHTVFITIDDWPVHLLAPCVDSEGRGGRQGGCCSRDGTSRSLCLDLPLRLAHEAQWTIKRNILVPSTSMFLPWETPSNELDLSCHSYWVMFGRL